MKSAAATIADDTHDDAWHSLSTHDFRCTWATALPGNEVDSLITLEWNGWEDLETFPDYYKGAYLPAALRRARQKVDLALNMTSR